MVDYKKITVLREGEMQDGDILYSVNSTMVNNELIKLSCTVSTQTEDSVGVHSSIIGTFSYDNGRIITELRNAAENSIEDLIAYINQFQKIIDEVKQLCDKNTKD